MEKDVTPMPTMDEETKLKIEFQTKCFEAGRLRYNIQELESKQANLEKQLEVTEQAVKKAANKLNEFDVKKLAKGQAPQTNKEETPQATALQ